MFRRLQHNVRYGSYLKSRHGIKKFAEMAMGQLIRRVTKKSAFYREMNENLLVEKANLRMRAEELFEQPMLNASEFFSVRRRLWANNLVVAAVIAASAFLVAVSVSGFLAADETVGAFLQWTVSIVLAIVLTGGGLLVAERLIEVLLPHSDPSNADPHGAGSPISILWMVLLVGIELAILGITEVRAASLSAAHGSAVLYVGFIALSMMLPIIAGALRWDAMRFIDRFKTTDAHREIDSRLAQIDSILRQNEEYESNFYKLKSIEYWDLLNEFRTLKDLYNEKHEMVEQIGSHFSQSYDSFQHEAFKRYESDLRDFATPSMRHLDVGRSRPGSKIGQAKNFRTASSSSAGSPRSGDARSREAASRDAGSRERTRTAREPAPNAESKLRDGDVEIREDDVYLSAKPIR